MNDANAAPEIEDLSQPRTGRNELTRHEACIAARRGIDVIVHAPFSWTVCSMCNRPSNAVNGTSVCCFAPVRILGWAP